MNDPYLVLVDSSYFLPSSIYQGVRNVSFTENFNYLLNEWSHWVYILNSFLQNLKLD